MLPTAPAQCLMLSGDVRNRAALKNQRNDEPLHFLALLQPNGGWLFPNLLKCITHSIQNKNLFTIILLIRRICNSLPKFFLERFPEDHDSDINSAQIV